MRIYNDSIFIRNYNIAGGFVMLFLTILFFSWGTLGLLFFIKPTQTKLKEGLAKGGLLSNLKNIVQDVSEEGGDEDAMVNVTFFQKPIAENRDFYGQLTSDLQKEFSFLFILDHPKHLAKQLSYKIGGENQLFFSTVFNFIYTYRKIISLALLTEIYNELVRLANDEPNTLTLLNEAMIRTTYYRRKDQAFLTKTIAVAQADISLHQHVLKSEKMYIHSFVRLAIILEKKKDFKGAIKLIDDALKRQLKDRTKGGFEKRRERNEIKMKHIKGNA